jgi:hypothetical protein
VKVNQFANGSERGSSYDLQLYAAMKKIPFLEANSRSATQEISLP